MGGKQGGSGEIFIHACGLCCRVVPPSHPRPLTSSHWGGTRPSSLFRSNELRVTLTASTETSCWGEGGREEGQGEQGTW
mgnify:CR=1 FL=1